MSDSSAVGMATECDVFGIIQARPAYACTDAATAVNEKGTQMKRRALRGVFIALLAVVVILPATARPANAVTLGTVEQVIDIANKGVTLVRNILGGGVSDAELRGAVKQIIAAIEAAKMQIIGHIDAIAAAEVRACTRHHVIEFADIELLRPDALQRWAQDATGCATLADSVLRAVTDKAAADNIGIALNVIGPIALAARARAGFRTFGLIDTLRGGNEAIVVKLAPDCRRTATRIVPTGPLYRIDYRCVAYNGDQAVATGTAIYPTLGVTLPPIDQVRVQAEATKQTSRAVAAAVLPNLISSSPA